MIWYGMVWYGMVWHGVISYHMMWYDMGSVKESTREVHWDMDWTCRESLSNSCGAASTAGMNKLKPALKPAVGWFKQQTSDQNFTQEWKIWFYSGIYSDQNRESSSPSLPCRSIGIDKPRSWNKQWLLKPQEVASSPVTSSDIRWHQVTSGDIRGLLFTLLAAESQKEVPKDEVNDQNQNTQGWKDLSLSNWEQFGVGFLKK